MTLSLRTGASLCGRGAFGAGSLVGAVPCELDASAAEVAAPLLLLGPACCLVDRVAAPLLLHVGSTCICSARTSNGDTSTSWRHL